MAGMALEMTRIVLHDINFVCSAIEPEDVTSLMLLATKEQIYPGQPYKHRSFQDALTSKHDFLEAYKDHQTRTLVESLLHHNAVLKLNLDIRKLGYDSESEDDEQHQDIEKLARKRKREINLRELKREKKLLNTRQKEEKMVRKSEIQHNRTNDCAIHCEDSDSESEFLMGEY